MIRACSTILLLASPALVAAGNVQSGQAVYVKSCKVCHGAQGEGNAAVAKALKVNIPDLGSSQVQSQSDDELRKAITEGKGKMKPVKTISTQEVGDVLSYMRKLTKK